MTASQTAAQTPHFLPAKHLQQYRGVAGHWDEAMTADGETRPHWQHFVDTLAPQSPTEIQGRQDLCRRLLRESGVTYTPADRELSEERPWQLDSWPVLISAAEWQSLSEAVAQRARVLNLLLADIYGEQKLIRGGDLPPEIVYGNPAFAHAAHGLKPPGDTYLHFYAVDVARSPDGRWWTVGDRADTPSGAGYALENRIVMNRVYPDLIRDCHVQRLARFFQQLRDGLLARATPRGREPRIVVYTPGPYHSTYFEQTYLARYLGFNLVEGRDLTVRNEQVFLKTLSGLLPVDVILRRVDTDYCDPLELRDDSLLGIAGLLQAARAGNVVIANSIGAGVVETPVLLPFLPNLCQRLLGEPLLMPPVATWWCGHDDALASVAAQVDRLVIKHAFNGQTFMPGQFVGDEMIARLKNNPQMYLGQEYVALSTSPTWQAQQFVPRHLMIRLFATALSNGEYAVMPGGLTRAGNSSESMLMTVQTGGGSKDTWVLSDSPPDTTSLLTNRPHSSDLSRAGFALPSRLADDLYWLGRYVERIEFGCRLTRSLIHRMTNEDEFDESAPMKFLVDLLSAEGRLPADRAASETLDEAIESAVFDLKNLGGIAHDLDAVRRIALGVRDRLSIDAWRILTDMCDDFARRPTPKVIRTDEQLAAVEAILGRLSAFAGQIADGMTRDQGWLFLDVGRRLERVIDLAHLLQFGLLQQDDSEATRLLAILEIANSAMTYRSRYVSGPEAARVLDLLLSDETNPRSIGFQLSMLHQHVRKLRTGRALPQEAPELKLVTTAFSDIRLLDVDALARYSSDGRRTHLAEILQTYMHAMEELSSVLTRTYLTHVQSSRSWKSETE